MNKQEETKPVSHREGSTAKPADSAASEGLPRKRGRPRPAESYRGWRRNNIDPDAGFTKLGGHAVRDGSFKERIRPNARLRPTSGRGELFVPAHHRAVVDIEGAETSGTD